MNDLSINERIRKELYDENIPIDEDVLKDNYWTKTLFNCIDFFDNLEYSDSDEIETKYSIGFNNGLLSFSMNTISKAEVLTWIVSIATSSSNSFIEALKIALPFLIKRICILSNEERCVFSIIVYITKNDKTKKIAKAEIANYYNWDKESNHCPFYEYFNCECRNIEDNTLCGYNYKSFDLEKILINLDKLDAIDYDRETQVLNIK